MGLGYELKNHPVEKDKVFLIALRYEKYLIFAARLNDSFVKLIKSKSTEMTKAEIVTEIASKTGIEKVAVQATVEALMATIKNSLVRGDNVYLRGFGSFIIKKRARKTGRNISKNTTIIIPAHNIPSFKPAKEFVNEVKESVVLEA